MAWRMHCNLHRPIHVTVENINRVLTYVPLLHKRLLCFACGRSCIIGLDAYAGRC